MRGCSYAEVRTNEQARSRDSDAASLWIYARGRVWLIWFTIGVAHIYRPVARLRISLSSGIRMFARESETRVVYLNHCFCCRAGSRIPNHTWIGLCCRGLALEIALKWSERPISLASVSEHRINPVRQHISNWTCSLSLTKMVIVYKFKLKIWL